MGKFRHHWVWATAPLIGGGLYTAALLSSSASSGKLLVWTVIAMITVGIVAFGAYRLVRPTAPDAAYLMTPPVFMTASAFLYVLLAETRWGRYGVVSLAVLLAAVYFDNLRSGARAEPEKRDDLAHLAFLLDLVGLYFLLAFAFGIQQFYYVPTFLMAAAAAAAAAFVMIGNLRRSGIDPMLNNRAVIFLAALAAQLYVVLAFLPVSHLVDAAVAVVLTATALQITRQILSGAFDMLNIRRELAVSVGLAGVLLITARWL